MRVLISPEYLVWEVHCGKLFIYQKESYAKMLQLPYQANMVRMAVSWQNIGNVIQFQVIRFQGPEESLQCTRIISIDQKASGLTGNKERICIPVFQSNHFP